MYNTHDMCILIIKDFEQQLVDSICTLFNESLRIGIVPAEWKKQI